MKRDELSDLSAFVAVADERSFTRAARRLGVSPSALSHSMKALETRLGVRLLTRTTRSVSTSEAGERLLATLRPAFAEIETGLGALHTLRDKAAGTVRITTFKYAARRILMPMLPAFLSRYPDIKVEISVDDALTNIVESRYDCGIRWAEKVAKDMVAVTVGPPLRFAVVGAPSYFAERGRPQRPRDLLAHRCINYRIPGAGTVYPWELEKNGRMGSMKVDGPLVVNDGDLMLEMAIAGVGLGITYEEEVKPHIRAGRLVRVLVDWTPPYQGLQLYYPSRKHTPPALAALIDALRVKKRR